jgi:ubiquinone/menaquinone biosynthesis C-methylase UbiE
MDPRFVEMRLLALLHNFGRLNQDVCERLARYLPHTRINIHSQYVDVVATRIESSDPRLILDVGGGNACPYAKRRPSDRSVKLVAVDLSLDAMRHNTDVDEKRVGDAMGSLPFADGEVDLLTSRCVLEHVSDIDRFLAESARILRRGGYSIHLFTCKFAWFAVLNRLLDHRFSKRVLYVLHPESRNKGGFPAVYDRCYYSGVIHAAEQNGLEVIDVFVSYGTNYCYFFVPLFILVSLYEILLQALKLRNLAATLVIVTRKA